MLPNTTPADVEKTVTRVLDLVRHSHPLVEAPGFTYSCSAGVVMLDPALDAKQNVGCADRALYAAKANGRDQLVWDTDAPQS